MVDYLDSWIRIFEGRLRNLQSEEGTPCGEVALCPLAGPPFMLYFDFKSQVALWLRCLQFSVPLGLYC